MKQASPLYIHCCGIINPLGHDQATVRGNLLAGNTDGVRVWERQIQGRAVHVGFIDQPLPDIPASLAQFDCRNNRLLLAALQQIQVQVDALLSQFPASRIAIVMA